MTELPTPVAVVTGASRGIGRSICLALAKSGLDIVVHARQSAREAEQTAEEVRSLGRRAQVLLCDLRDHDELPGFVERAFAWQTNVTTWVNNAGFDVLTGEAAQLPFAEKLAQLWQTDVLGTIYCCRLVGERMREMGGGQLINIGWDQAWHGMEGDSGEMFATIKGAIMSFTKSSAKSLAPHVRVNCVAPGWIRTSWGSSQASDYWHERAVGESLRGRWGTPADVASAVAFLASPAADFINGQVLPVNGGFRSAQPRN